jgi:transposase-like protein
VPIARHDRGFWERACDEVERGAKVAEVAGRIGVRAGTLSWWLWKLRREVAKGRRRKRTSFLPVVVAQPVRSAPAIVELEASGVRLRVEVGTDVRYVADLLAAIRAAC